MFSLLWLSLHHNATANISTLLAMGVVAAWLWFLWSRRRYYRVYWRMPGPWGWPLIGMAWHMLNPETFLSYMRTKSQSYTTPFISWMGPNCFLFVNDPETVEAIFNSPHCKNKSTFYRLMADAMGDGLFTSSGARWAKHRRLINPAFSRQVIGNFVPIFNAEANELLQRFQSAAAHGERLEIYNVFKKSVLEMACQTTMGRKMDFQQNRSAAIFDAYNCLTDVMVRRMLTPWLHLDCIYRRSILHARQQQVINVLYAFVENLLQSAVSKSDTTISNATAAATTTTIQPAYKGIAATPPKQKMNGIGGGDGGHGGHGGNGDVVNGAAGVGDDDIDARRASSKFIFVEQVRKCVDTGQFTWQDVRDEANVIIAATFETTSTALYFVCLCLAMHPECQDKLFAELLAAFPQAEDVLCITDAARLARLPYTDMAINEALRLFAPVPIVLRSVAQDFVLSHRSAAIGDVLIPRGTQIGIDIFNMQRDTRVWGAHALEYRPELHFGAAAQQQQHPFAFVPFTRGLRMCIGYRYALLLMKLLVVKVFRHYRLRTEARLEDIRVKGTISLKLRDYPLCELLPR